MKKLLALLLALLLLLSLAACGGGEEPAAGTGGDETLTRGGLPVKEFSSSTLESKRLPGLFACGDLVGTPYQYIKAAGEGNIAALSAVSYLDQMKRSGQNG